jgi:hypothetical protein
MEEEPLVAVPLPPAAAAFDEVARGDEEAENAMMREGLANSQVFDTTELSWGKGATVFASAADLLGTASTSPQPLQDERQEEVADVLATGGSALAAPPKEVCLQARTVLMMPFSYYQAEDKESPAFLAEALLTRQLEDGSEEGGTTALWERARLPREAAELSLHFRELLGDDTSGSPVQRLRLTDRARSFLFSEARLWADTRTGFAGRHCDWSDVTLQLFSHGGILSVSVNWLGSADGAAFSLADLRTWVYVSKFRSVKVGVTRGWSFLPRPAAGEDKAQRAREQLGLKLFAAVCGGSCVSLAAVANWLVMMPWDKTAKIPRYVNRTDYCQHHSFASLLDAAPPSPQELEAYLFHTRKQYGSAFRRPVPSDEYAELFVPDETWRVRRNCVLSVAAGGAVGIEWGGLSPMRSFSSQFFGPFLLLKRHCLSERVALEKLSYLAALHSQGLSRSSDLGRAESQKVRFELTRLTSLLVHYRTSMASDDCGGSAEARKQFKMLRQVHGIAALKQNLFEQLQDVEYIMSCEMHEEDKLERQKELSMLIYKEGLEQKQKALLQGPKVVFDVFFFAFSAIVFPLVLLATMWGSNQNDLPRGVSWGWLLVGSAFGSIVLLLLFLFIYLRMFPRLKQLEQSRKEHIAAGASQMKN